MGKRLVWALILAAYGAVLIRVLVFKDIAFRVGRLRFRIPRRVGPPNLTPFRSIWLYLSTGRGSLIATANLAGNILLFVPIGFFAPLVWPKMGWKAALALAVACGLTVESLQLALQVGTFDVDDIFLNAVGVMAGYGAARALARWAGFRRGMA